MTDEDKALRTRGQAGDPARPASQNPDAVRAEQSSAARGAAGCARLGGSACEPPDAGAGARTRTPSRAEGSSTAGRVRLSAAESGDRLGQARGRPARALLGLPRAGLHRLTCAARPRIAIRTL